jgi:predicted alpha/beta-fold hydrolase
MSCAANDLDFRPLPLLGNPHLQTLLGAFLPGRWCPPPDRRHVVRLPDGDGLLLHENVPPGWRPGGPMALLVHGLTGSHASTHVRRLAGRLLARRVRVVRIDLRGTGYGLPLARGFYHAGRSDDLRAALLAMQAWSPSSPLLLLGVSLGGALALKLAGEKLVPNLARVAALAPPLDLVRCSALLSRPGNRIYEDNFVRDLVADARRRQRLFPDLPPLRLPRRPTLAQFDELYTAPRSGFAGALDYYTKASCAPLIERIAVPALLLTARDDPFIAVQPFEELKAPPHVTVRILARGGHVGFLGRDGAGGFRWAERYAVEWLLG